MRVLFIGNYDIAGKYIAERLFKEGHRIAWHTNEPGKNLWDASVKGNVYRYELNHKNCSQIMKAESPDCIVLLTQEYRDVYDWTEDRMILLKDTETEILRAASSLSVKKVLYLSSKELERETLFNPALEKLRAGERLCRAVCTENRMECLIVRSGIVYGEEEELSQGFVERIVTRMLQGRKLSTKFACGAQFDFVHGSDYADAIERLLTNEETGTHLITTGYPVVWQDFLTLAAEQTEARVPVEYGVTTHAEIPENSLKFKRITGWMPFHMYESEMPSVIQNYIHLIQNEETAKEKRKQRKEHPFLKGLIQNIVIFALFLVLDYFSSDWSDIRFVDVKLLYVVVIALSFGMRQGIVAILFAVFAYFAKMSYAEIDFTYIAYSIDTWVPFIMYGIAGTVVGYISDKKTDDVENKEEEFETLHDKYSFLKTMYQEVLNIKNQLQKQIMISKDSLGHIYDITEELNDTRPRTVMLRTVKVVEETMECSSVAIFTKSPNSSYGRLTACSADIAREMTGSVNFADYKEMEDVLLQNEIYVNTALKENYPGFAMPVFDGNDMVAVVAIYNLDPAKYTVYYKNLFKTLILIMRTSLIRAYNYQEINREQIFVQNTGVLCAEEFEAELKSIRLASDELQYPFSLGKVICDATLTFTEMADKLSRSIRATDISGCDTEGNIHIILLFVTPASRMYTEQRFEKVGMRIEWEN